MKIVCILLCFTAYSLVVSTDLDLILLEGHPGESACLDGSPYGYYYRPGTDTTKFIIFHHGGGWCYNMSLCAERSRTVLGSSKTWPNKTDAFGILSDSPQYNPHLYTWNVAWLYYCDGTSFTGYKKDPIKYGDYTLYIRGISNLNAAANDLIENRGLNKATDVIIGGSSAGALATYLHLDYWKSLVPATAVVRGIADAGWFLDTSSFYGYSIYTPEMMNVFEMMNSTNGVNSDCITAHTKQGDPWRCIMAEYTYPYIQTPIFMVNSKYDSWQMGNVYDLPCSRDILKCNTTEKSDFLNYGKTFLSTLSLFEKSSKDGMFVDACYIHTQTNTDNNYWTKVTVPLQNGVNVTASEAFNNWYTVGAMTKAIQFCDYPCNPTCDGKK